MCTAIAYQSTGHHHYFGRTLDFPTKVSRWQLTFLPAGYRWRPLPRQASYQSRFAILGGMRPIGDHLLAADGINAAGLVAAELYFPGQVSYQTAPQPGKLNLSPQDLIGWLLARHQSVAEVARTLDQVRIVGQPWYDHDRIHPFHWVLQDASGPYLIEPTGPHLRLQRLALGVVTNAPAYPVHLRRLREVVGAWPANDAPALLTQLQKYQGPLPQARTPRARFVATAIRLAHALPIRDPAAPAIGQAILDQVRMAHRPGHADYTHYQGLIDLTAQRYWFTPTATDQTVSVRLAAAQQQYSQPHIFTPSNNPR